ncbi:MAG: amidohydrolase [Bacteroidetes bacterium]|nr:MAG: amidohydrolase [Bacteroidota bacterium]
MSSLRIAFIQAELHWEDAIANRAQFEQYFNRISTDVDLIVLPEMFTTGFSMNPAPLAEPMDGPTHAWLREWAARKQATLTGSLIIREGAHYYNRLLWVRPDGITATYDKRHLFSLAGEQHAYTAGRVQQVMTCKGWRILPLICYDLRFPVWSRNTMDYDLLLYVANFPDKRAHAWRSLLQARAIENQAYVLGVNRVGVDGNGIYYAGESCLIDYAGHFHAHLPATPASAEVNLDREKLHSFRQRFAFLPDRDRFRFM